MATARTALLIEGVSDAVALRVLARRLGRDLEGEGVDLVVLDGITNVRAAALRYGPAGLGLHLAGLYDAGEERVVRRGLAAAGLPVPTAPRSLTELEFHACHRDLEDELVRAVGLPGVHEVIEQAGEGRSLRLLAQMPAQRGWTQEQVVHRFLGSQGGRKARYAELLAEAVELDRAPEPLVALLHQVGG